MWRRARTLRALESLAALLAVAGLSFALTAATLAEEAGSPSRAWPVVAFVSGVLLAMEWAARLLLAPGHRKAPKGAVLDGLAALSLVLPTTRIPAFALLRLLRLWTLVRRGGRLVAHRQRGPRTLLVATGVVGCTVVCGTAAILLFERGQNPTLGGFDHALWFSFYSLFAQEPGDRGPYTLGGHLATLGMMFTGLGTFAVLTGTVSALVSERIRSPELHVDWQDLRDHLIICGWSRKAEVVVREYRAHLARAHDQAGLDMPVVVIAELDHPPAFTEAELRPHVQFLSDDFTKVAALEKAGVRKASRVVLLSDTTRGRRERDADARTILAALTIEKLNHEVYTCAEINRREYGAHLEMGNVNDYVVAGEHSAFLLAQGALNRGMVGLFTELFSRSAGNRLCHAEVGACWKGRSFFDLFVHLKESEDAILVAVVEGGNTVLNPHSYELRGGERVVLIAAHDVRLDRLPDVRDPGGSS